MGIARKNERTPLQRFLGDRRRHPDWPAILCEGDSWFAYPGTNLPREIKKLGKNRVAMLNLQSNGHEATEMLSGSQRRKLRARLQATSFDLILFSAGGNDIVGDEFARFLCDGSQGGAWDTLIRKDRFERRLGQIRDAYLDLISLRDDGKNPHCHIIVHGYDRPRPGPRPFRIAGYPIGPWMYPSLIEAHIKRPSDQRRIVGYCIDRFNEMLAELSQEHAHVHHIDLRGTLKPKDWANEIHPTRAAFVRLAGKYQPTLCKIFPGRF